MVTQACSTKNQRVADLRHVLLADCTSSAHLGAVMLFACRVPIRALVSNVAAAKSGYGPYVDPVSVSIDDPKALQRVMKGVRTLVVLGRLGRLIPAAKAAGVEQVVLLSTAGALGAEGQGGALPCLRIGELCCLSVVYLRVMSF